VAVSLIQEDGGLLVLDAMRSANPDSVILLLTVHSGSEIVQAAFREAIDYFFVKPVNVDEVVGAIKRRRNQT
jgi:ActR/RegA family two-component response regulator